jgi:hypothetical protein
MSIAVSGPLSGSPLPSLLLRRFTVDEYHEMIRSGILAEDEPVELLEGWIVIKRARNPPARFDVGEIRYRHPQSGPWGLESAHPMRLDDRRQ